MQYKHTQVGIVTLAVFGIITALLVFASMSKPEEPIGFVFIVLAIASVLFSTLTVKVDDTNIRWFFGPNFWVELVGWLADWSSGGVKTL